VAAGVRVFRPEHRLRRPAEFSAVLAGSQRVRGQYFDLRYRSNPGSGTRLGLIIPKRLARRAVVRNLLKRLARESFRNAAAGLPEVDLVLRLTRPVVLAGTSDRHRLRASWRSEMDGLLAGVPR
jgi:ribonuclease P protein component